MILRLYFTLVVTVYVTSLLLCALSIPVSVIGWVLTSCSLFDWLVKQSDKIENYKDKISSEIWERKLRARERRLKARKQ